MKKFLITSILTLSILTVGCTSKNSSQEDAITVSFPTEILTLDEDYINKAKQENGVYDIIVNQNSINYILSPEKLEEYKSFHISETEEYLNYLIESSPDIENISYSENLNEFIVYTTALTVSESDKNIAFDLIKQGKLYQPLINQDANNTEIIVNFLSNSSEKVIERFSSNSINVQNNELNQTEQNEQSTSNTSDTTNNTENSDTNNNNTENSN